MDSRLLVKVCKWYYEDQINQEEIAKRIGISRSTISRMLTQARRQGVVKITVEPSPSDTFDFDLETYLESRFDLAEVVICNCEQQAPGPVLGAMAADLLLRTLSPGHSVGLSWGRSVAAVVEALPRTDPMSQVTIVALSGGVGAVQQNYLGNTLVLKLADRLGAQAVTLDAPAIVQHETYTRLMTEPAISRVLARASAVDIALVGIGAVGVFSTLTATEYLDPRMVAELEAMNAVGDICSRFYRLDGTPLDSDIDQRTIGIPLETLKRIPRVIGIGWGPEKIQAIMGALRMGVLDVLVTDRPTAQQLKNQSDTGGITHDES